jgi:dTDP-4-dehydrorhamnose reductase
MQKILILGSTGMLGLQVLRALQELKNFKIYATYKDKKKKLKLKNLIKINNNVSFIKFNVSITSNNRFN